MSEPTPPGVPQDPQSSPPPATPPTAPPSAPPSAPVPPPAAPPPPPGGGYAAGPPISGNIAPVGYANNDEKTWALVTHFGGAGAAFISSGYLGWVPALVALLVKGNESPTVRAHAVAALNFQIVWAAVAVIGTVLLCIVIGFIPLVVAWLMGTIFGIIAGIKANEGTLYKYPMSPNLIK